MFGSFRVMSEEEATGTMAHEHVQGEDPENEAVMMKRDKQPRPIRPVDLPKPVAEELQMLDVDGGGTLSTSEII